MHLGQRSTSQPAVTPRHTARHGAHGANVGAAAVTDKKARPKLSELKGTLNIGDQTFEAEDDLGLWPQATVDRSWEWDSAPQP